ncbi:hypothetical protein SAMN04488063_2065 [Halopelagius inordinatus]|uniref:DUF8106 domain-containing protein n=1 Tax=Halopelagius inordinatus TaxID=553467 RepID=A0A1I2S0G8_9EURY|nr:hypothetical protein [Halopelagius inordinatus]SFG44357.1 hypothetical protein SAMN04488063_2065 [Halopelagius inordinatus]
MSVLERNPNRTEDNERSTVRKAVLFCPDCGRAAPPDEWERTARDGVETLECPACDATLTARPRALA